MRDYKDRQVAPSKTGLLHLPSRKQALSLRSFCDYFV